MKVSLRLLLEDPPHSVLGRNVVSNHGNRNVQLKSSGFCGTREQKWQWTTEAYRYRGWANWTNRYAHWKSRLFSLNPSREPSLPEMERSNDQNIRQSVPVASVSSVSTCICPTEGTLNWWFHTRWIECPWRKGAIGEICMMRWNCRCRRIVRW